MREPISQQPTKTNQSNTNIPMKKPSQMAAMTIIALALSLGSNLTAQAQSRTNRVGNQDFRNIDWQNMDPKEIQKMIQERMMESFRDRLEVTDDAEWKIIGERLSKITQARMATMADGGGMGGFGAMGFGRGGGGQGGGRGFQALLGEPSAESQALQQAIDSKASNSELKQTLAKFQEARKQKLAEVVKAQSELRRVLSPRQEAIAVLMGVLE